jgi:hypothetical protein
MNDIPTSLQRVDIGFRFDEIALHDLHTRITAQPAMGGWLPS